MPPPPCRMAHGSTASIAPRNSSAFARIFAGFDISTRLWDNKTMEKPVSFTNNVVTAVFCLCAVCFCLVGCEKDDTVGGQIVDSVTGDNNKASENLTGTWTGISGSNKSQTTVTVSDSNGAISGTLRWSWGGVRSFSGSRAGNSVVWTTLPDNKGAQDTWQMTLSGDRRQLTGYATKSDGGGYSISLSR